MFQQGETTTNARFNGDELMYFILFQIDPKLAFPRRAHPKVSSTLVAL